MDISKVNDLLGQVRVKLESLDPNNEGIEVINAATPGSVSTANGKMANLIAKLAPGGRKPKATGTSKHK